MQLRPEQLEADLNRQLRPVYLISGDEPLQVLEAADAVRRQARAEGFEDREVMHVASGFDWNSLLASANALSLFANRKIIDLRLPSGKPGKEGGAALREYCERLPEDTILLITTAKLDQSSVKTAWVKALEKAGALLRIWPVDARALPGWIKQRLASRGLRTDPDGLRFLAERVEGNLLAAAQEVDKLALLHGSEGSTAGTLALSLEQLHDAVSDSARYDVWGLVETLLQGQAGHAQHMLAGLKAEGVAAPAVLWALANEARNLHGMAVAIGNGMPRERVFQQQRVFDKRKPAVTAALNRLSPARLLRLTRRCAQADRVIKGQAAGRPWDALASVVHDFSR